VRALQPNPGARLTKVLRLFTDGAARGNPGPAGLGIVIEDENGKRLDGKKQYIGRATNNEAEYRALIEGLKAAAEWKPERLEVYLDSKLVVEQVNGSYRVRKPELQPLYQRAKELLGGFDEVVISHVEREKNRGADALANMALDDHVKDAASRG
jgi:ribonuclease HI